MSKYLVLITTLGSIRGICAKEFVAGETVDLDDDDLAGVGCRDGWLTPVDDLSGTPPAPELPAYTVLLPDAMPLPRSGWEADRPKEGDTVHLSDEEAAPLLEVGAVQLVTESGITETDQFPEDYTQYVALHEIQLDESGDLIEPGEQFGMSAAEATDWIEAGLIEVAPASEDAPNLSPATGGPLEGGTPGEPVSPATAPKAKKPKAKKKVGTDANA